MKRMIYILLTFGSVAVNSENFDAIEGLVQAAIKCGKRVEVLRLSDKEVIIRLKDKIDGVSLAVENEYLEYDRIAA